MNIEDKTGMQDLELQEISRYVWEDKYKFKKPDGTSQELTIEDTHRRVTKGIYINDNPLEEEKAFQAMRRGDWMPAGRIHAGAGTGRRITLINCFVSDQIQDSMSTDDAQPGIGIMRALEEAALTQQMGGGIGMDFSTIRPNLAEVKRTGSVSSGVVPFMDMWNSMCATIRSAGSRRGAMMATLACWHPDVEEFFLAKQTAGRLTNFNVSILVTEPFMKAVKEDLPWELIFPVPRADGKHEGQHMGNPHDYTSPNHEPWYVYKTIRARDLWEKILKNTYEFAEPGVIFIDRINETNNLKYCETIHCTNPCGEQPLPPNGDCNLGHVNLATMVNDPFGDTPTVNWPRLIEATRIGVRFLDNVLDVTLFPTEKQKAEALAKRRIGLGITGLANLLQQMKLHYGSEDARNMTATIMREIACTVYDESATLAKERGPFPLYDKTAISNAPFVRKLPLDLEQKIYDQGLRNGVLLSIAPTGTTSNYYGVISSGCEPSFEWLYDRKVRMPGASDNEWKIFENIMDYGFLMYKKALFPHLKVKGIKGKEITFEDPTSGHLIPHTLPDYMVTALELSVDQHLEMQGVIQDWVDASISKTVNCPKEMPFEEFSQVYMKAYDLGLKGCTTYRPSGVRGEILIKKEEPKVVVYQPPGNPPPRQEILEGKTYKLKWPGIDNAFYLTINDTVDPDTGTRIPFEIFINTKSVVHQEWIHALTRTISAVFRRGGDVQFLVEELTQVFSAGQGNWIRQKYVPSLVALIGLTIADHLKASHQTQSVALRPAVLVEDKPDIPTNASQCPKCGAPALVHKEGCADCRNCGYSQCS